MKHELGKTALSLTLNPMFLQLLLFGGGPLRELTHALRPKHTHTLTQLSHSPTPGALVVFLPRPHPSLHTPLIKVRRANKTGSLPDVSGALPTCWVKQQPNKIRERSAPTELARFCSPEALPCFLCTLHVCEDTASGNWA